MTDSRKDKLIYRLQLLKHDCHLMISTLEHDGPNYHNLDLLEMHLAKYRAIALAIPSPQ